MLMLAWNSLCDNNIGSSASVLHHVICFLSALQGLGTHNV